jgi:hypothetical protein
MQLSIAFIDKLKPPPTIVRHFANNNGANVNKGLNSGSHTLSCDIQLSCQEYKGSNSGTGTMQATLHNETRTGLVPIFTFTFRICERGFALINCPKDCTFCEILFFLAPELLKLLARKTVSYLNTMQDDGYRYLHGSLISKSFNAMSRSAAEYKAQ